MSFEPTGKSFDHDDREEQNLGQSPSFPQQNGLDLRNFLNKRSARSRSDNSASNDRDQGRDRGKNDREQDNVRGHGNNHRQKRDFYRRPLKRSPPCTIFNVIQKVEGEKGRFSGQQRVSGQRFGRLYSCQEGRRFDQNRYNPHHNNPRDSLNIVGKTDRGNYRCMSKLLTDIGSERRPEWFAKATPKEQANFLKRSNNTDYLDLGPDVYGRHVALFYNDNNRNNKGKQVQTKNHWARVLFSGFSANCVKHVPDPGSHMFTINAFIGKYDVTPGEAENLKNEIGEKKEFSKFCSKSMPRTDEQGGRSIKISATVLAKVVEHEIAKTPRDLPETASVAVIDIVAPVPPKTARTTGDLENKILHEDAPPSQSCAPDFVPTRASFQLATIVKYPSCKFVAYNTEGTWRIARYTSPDAFRSTNLDRTNFGCFGIYATYALKDLIQANKDKFLRIKAAADSSAAELKHVAENCIDEFVQNDGVDVSRAKTCPGFKERNDEDEDTPELTFPAVKAFPYSYCRCMTNPPFTKGAAENLEKEVVRVNSIFQDLCGEFLSEKGCYCFRSTTGPLEHNFNKHFIHGGSVALKAENDLRAAEEERQARASTQAAFGIPAPKAHVFKDEEACGRCRTGDSQLVFVWHVDPSFDDLKSEAGAAKSQFDARFVSFENKNVGVLERQTDVSQEEFVREAMDACKRWSACCVEFKMSDCSWIEHKAATYEQICTVLGDDGQTNPIAAIVSRFFAGPRDEALSNAIISGPRRGREDILKCFESNDHTLNVFCIFLVFFLLDRLILEKKMEKRGLDTAIEDTIEDMVCDLSSGSGAGMDWISDDTVLDFPFELTGIICDEENVITELEAKLRDDYNFKDLCLIVCRDEYNFGINSTKLIASICAGFKNMLAAEKQVSENFVTERQGVLTDNVRRLCETMKLENFNKSVIEKKHTVTDMERMYNPNRAWAAKLID